MTSISGMLLGASEELGVGTASLIFICFLSLGLTGEGDDGGFKSS
jgi:hypothetical protein